MAEVGYYNGAIGPLSEMAVPMEDRAVYFGDGVYDFALVRNGRIFKLAEHLERFYHNLELMEIDFPMEREELTGELRRVLAYAGSGGGSNAGGGSGSGCNASSGFGSEGGSDPNAGQTELGLYWQVSRGSGSRKHAFPDPPVKPNLMIMAAPKSMNAVGRKVKLITLEDTRSTYCPIKTLNLLPNIMARQAAVSRGCDEAVFHRDGAVTECAASNIFILKNGALRTSPPGVFIMPGITRRLLLEQCGALKIPVDETAFTLEEMMDADEVIITSTSRLCAGADAIDGQQVGGKAHALLSRLQDACLEYFLKETEICTDGEIPSVHLHGN